MQSKQPSLHQSTLNKKNSTVTKHLDCFPHPIGSMSYEPYPSSFPNPPPELRYNINSMNMHFDSIKFSHPFGPSIADQIQFTTSYPMHSLPLRNVAAEGMRAVCEIDMLMLKNYYPIREKIFNKSNQPQPKRMESSTTLQNWIKGRLSYRFKANISSALNRIVDEVYGQLGNKTEDEQQTNIDSNVIDVPEINALDKEMREKKQVDNREYLPPKVVVQKIVKFIEIYFSQS